MAVVRVGRLRQPPEGAQALHRCISLRQTGTGKVDTVLFWPYCASCCLGNAPVGWNPCSGEGLRATRKWDGANG